MSTPTHRPGCTRTACESDCPILAAELERDVLLFGMAYTERVDPGRVRRIPPDDLIIHDVGDVTTTWHDIGVPLLVGHHLEEAL